jgi:pimeloyl-ACP methyl ester carboxylesterase
LVLFFCLTLTTASAGDSAFKSNGVKIRYLTEGKGEVVILLHGFAVRGAEEMWIKNALNEPAVVKELSSDFRVIAVDLRGHGKSGKPRGPQHYGSEMVEDVVRLMDHLKIQQAHVVGYSLGAMIAGKLLVTHPDRLLSVTLAGGAPVYQPTEKWKAGVETLAKSLDSGAGAGPLVSAIAPPDEGRPPSQAINALGQLLVVGQDQKVLASVIRGMLDWEVSPAELAANKIPVLIIYGSREGESRERIGQVSKALAQAQTKIIDGGEHMTTFARPEFRTAIHEFLKQKRP